MSNLSQRAALKFCTSKFWEEITWIATTFRCHPSGEAPPVMGLVFAEWEVGEKLFASWTDDWGNQDVDDAIRVLFVEGDIKGQLPGYSVRISAEGSGESGQIQRMHPSEETQHLFAEFKAQYLHHGEFLLCPVVQKEDGQLWFNANAGIIKHKAGFRNAEDIGPDDPDAVVLQPSEAESALKELMQSSNQASDESLEK